MSSVKSRKAHLTVGNRELVADLSSFVDISAPVSDDPNGVRFFGIPAAKSEPIRMGEFVGSVKEGGLCNCSTLTLCAHGNATHTEGIGHISKEATPVWELIAGGHFYALLVSLEPERITEDSHLKSGDEAITRNQIEELLEGREVPEALIIRTLPNSPDRPKEDFTGTNPPFIHYDAARYLAEIDLNHLLLDLPSLDREEGDVVSHRAYWQLPEHPTTGERHPALADMPTNPRKDASACCESHRYRFASILLRKPVR